jgi:hypothetical protein
VFSKLAKQFFPRANTSINFTNFLESLYQIILHCDFAEKTLNVLQRSFKRAIDEYLIGPEFNSGLVGIGANLVQGLHFFEGTVCAKSRVLYIKTPDLMNSLTNMRSLADLIILNIKNLDNQIEEKKIVAILQESKLEREEYIIILFFLLAHILKRGSWYKYSFNTIFFEKLLMELMADNDYYALVQTLNEAHSNSLSDMVQLITTNGDLFMAQLEALANQHQVSYNRKIEEILHAHNADSLLSQVKGVGSAFLDEAMISSIQSEDKDIKEATKGFALQRIKMAPLQQSFIIVPDRSEISAGSKEDELLEKSQSHKVS